MKIIIIVGARPNFIKVAPLIEELKKYRQIDPILIHTGQHYDYEMSQSFFEDLKIPKPNYNLGVGSGSHAKQTAEIIEKLEPIILKENPDLVIVIGDVSSTFAGALTAAKLNIPVAHIEAGLRSYNKKIPEEINRILTDHVSDFLFCPTKTAVENLKNEGIKKGVYNVGDIMYDVLLKNIEIAQKKSKILEKFNLKPKEYFLLTIHRASNADNLDNLRKILAAANKIKGKVIFPVHPRTKKLLAKIEISQFENIKTIRPLGYFDMLVLEKNSKKILTDSGGVQKEAFWLSVPCITLREETEWAETLKFGWNILVGTSEEKIIKAAMELRLKKTPDKSFGNGNAAKKIMDVIEKIKKQKQ